MMGLLIQAFPNILSALIEPLSGIVDNSIIGQKSTQWLASLAIATIVINALTWIFNFTVNNTTQLIARAKNQNDKILAFKLVIASSLLIGFAVCLPLTFNNSFLLKWAGANETTLEQAKSYLAIRLLFHPISLLLIGLISFIRGLGSFWWSLLFAFITTISNIVLTYYLVIIKDGDLSSAAHGTIIAHFIGLGSLFIFIIVKHSFLIKGFLKVKATRQDYFQFGENSFNLAIRTGVLTTCFFLGTRWASGMGVVKLAQYQILMQFWLFISIILDGLAITATIYGVHIIPPSKNYHQWKKFEHLSLLLTGIIIAPLLIYSDNFINLFTSDPLVKKGVAHLFYLVIATAPLSALAYIYDGLGFGWSIFRQQRNVIFLGAVTIFIPLGLWSSNQQDLQYLFYGFIGLNIFRAVYLKYLFHFGGIKETL